MATAADSVRRRSAEKHRSLMQRPAKGRVLSAPAAASKSRKAALDAERGSLDLRQGGGCVETIGATIGGRGNRIELAILQERASECAAHATRVTELKGDVSSGRLRDL